MRATPAHEPLVCVGVMHKVGGGSGGCFLTVEENSLGTTFVRAHVAAAITLPLGLILLLLECLLFFIN